MLRVCVSVSEALCQCVKADLTLRLWTGWLQGVYRDPSGWPTPAPHVCPCVFVLMWVRVCVCVYVRVAFVGSCLACGEHLACAGWGFAKRSDSECYWLRVTIIGLPCVFVRVCVCVCVCVGAGQGCRGGLRLISIWLDCDSPLTFEEEVVFFWGEGV